MVLQYLAFLMCLSLLVPAYLRYYPFRHILTDKQKKHLLQGHLLIFLAEALLLALAFHMDWIPFYPVTFQRFYYFAPIVHFAQLLYTVRSYWFHHLFIAGIQGMYMFVLHSITMATIVQGLGLALTADNYLKYELLYNLLLLITLPGMTYLFRKIFPQDLLQNRPASWKFIGPLPLLLDYYQAIVLPLYDLDELWDYLLPRVLLITVGGLAVVMVNYGIVQYKETIKLQRRNQRLGSQLEQMNRYMQLLRDEQQKQAILRHDNRHQLRILRELIEEGRREDGLRMVKQLLKEMKP